LYNEELDTTVDSDFFKIATRNNSLNVLQAVWENSIKPNTEINRRKNINKRKNSITQRKNSKRYTFHILNVFGQKEKTKINSFNISDLIIHCKRSNNIEAIRFINC
jgi:hypothetical protein